MKVPPAAAVLGAAGLIPALFAVALVWFAAPDLKSTGAQLGLIYAALILSFLGGMWWGLASAPGRPGWGLLILAVMPALFALGCLLLAATRPASAAVVLGAAILLTLPVDAMLARAGLAPAWWMRLRIPLSVGLAAATLAVAAAQFRG